MTTGATVKVHAAESAAKKAPEQSADIVITDSEGRQLKIREQSILDESRLVRMLGDVASNQAYMFGYALPAAMVVEIDDVPNHCLTQPQLDAAIKRLGRHGIAAVMEHITSKARTQEAGKADDPKE